MNVIDLGYDMDKLTAQQKIVVEYFSKTLELADQLDRMKIAPDITGQQSLNEALGKQKKVLDDLSSTVQKYNSQLDALQKIEAEEIKTYEKRQAAGTSQARSLAEEKEYLRQRNAELKAGAQLQVAEANSIEEAKAKVKLLTQERDKLNLATDEGKKRQKELNSEIDKENDFIKANVSALEKQKINIGNYAGSFKEAFGVVEKELVTIRENLQKMKPGEAGFDKLARDEKLLAQITDNLNKTFSSSRQELKALTESTKQMGTEFGMADERFQAFVSAVGERKDQLDDIQKAINFQSSDTKYIDGVLSAVQGLAGGYAAAQAASSLFAEDDERLQKDLAKMQALLTLITGLQQLLNALQTESGAVQVALAAKTYLLNAAREVNLALTTQTAVAVEVETVAIAEQATASEAAAITLGEQAVANEAVAVTATEAAVATTGFATVMTATGIGALILALSAGVIYLVKNVYEWANADSILMDKQAKLAESIKAVNDALNAEISIIKDNSADRRKALENELSGAEKSGASQEKLFAIKKKIADFDKAAADQVVKHTGATVALAKQSETAYEAAATVVSSYERNIKAANQEIARAQAQGRDPDKSLTKYLDDDKEKLKSAQTTLEAAKSTRDKYKSALEDQENAAKSFNELAVEESKFTADERRKVVLESAKIESGIIQANNAIILADERSTQQQRILAMRSNLEEQKKIAQAEFNNVASTPGTSKADLKIARLKLSADLDKINKEEKENERKLNEDYRKRELAAVKAFDELMLNSEITKNNFIADNTAFTLEQRTEAFKKSVEDQKKLIDEDCQYQKATKILTDAELELLEADHEAKLVALKSSSAAKLIQISNSAYEQLYKDAADYYNRLQEADELAAAKRLASTEQKYSDDVIKLNASLQAGTISISKYNEIRKKLDAAHNKQVLKDNIAAIEDNLQSLKLKNIEALKEEQDYRDKIAELNGKSNKSPEEEAQLSSLQRLLANHKNYTKAIEQTDAQLSDARQQLSDADAANEIRLQQQIKDTRKQVASELVNLSQQLIDSGYQKEIEALQQAKEASDTRYSTEIDNIQKSNLSAQDKAAEVTQITAQQRAQALQVEREMRDIKNRQAKADRAFAAANIVENTAVAIMDVLRTGGGTHYLDFGVSAGILSGWITALGAIQLGTVLSKPIPQYALGTDNHPGGLAIVGEGEHQELVSPKGGKPFIADRAMLLDLPAGTTVQPLTQADVNEIMYYSMMRKTSELLVKQELMDQRKAARQENASREQLELLRRIAGKDTSVRNTVATHIDFGYMEHINKQVFGR